MKTLKCFYMMLTFAFSMTLGVNADAGENIVLTIKNNQGNEVEVQLSDDDLLTLPQISVSTSTPWNDGIINFSGPSLHSVLTQHNISSGEVKLTAVNRYEIVIPWPHIEKSVPIIANRMNDEPYPVREKGPLWLIFPFDDDSRYRTYEISAMSIWQLIRIEVN